MSETQNNVDVFIGSAANYGELTETAIADPLLATGNIGLYGPMGAVFGQTFTNQMAAMAAEWSGTGSGVSELGEGNGLASGSVTLTNTTGKTILIPVGSSFATASGVNFQAVADIHAGNWASNGTANDLGWYTVGAGASVTIPVEATSFGAGGNVAANAVANAAVAGLVVTASTAMSGGQSWTNPAQNNQGGFISTTPTQYTSVYSAQGYDPAETDVNVDGSHSWTAQDLQAWEGYVNNCRSVGILNVAPILSDNDYTADLAQPFATSAWFANERAAALYGGGLAFDTPPGYFFARNWDGYESNIEQQIQWCNQNGLRSSVIISPYALPNEPIVAGQAQGDDNLFLQKTEKFLADLKAAGALPTQIIVENYNAPASANYFDASTADVNSLNTIAQYAAGLTLSPVTASEAGLEEKDTSQATTTLIVTGVQVSQTIEASATGTPFAEAQLFGKQQSEIATVTVTDQGGLLHLASTVSGVTSENDALVYSGTVGQVTTFLQSLRATSAAATSATTDTLSLSIVDPNGATTEASAPVTIAAPTQITAIAATTSTGLQTLAAGATVTFTVDASRPLTVSGGTPLLDLSNGTTATYAGINGQGQLTFITTVAPGHDTSDLSVTSLQNNGAVIADAAGVPLATTSLATITGSNTGLTILTAIPTVNAITDVVSGLTSNGSMVTSGAIITFALTTSVPLTVSGGTPLLDLSNGTTATYAGINGQGQLTFITTVAPGHDTSDLSVTSLQNNGAVIADAAGVPLATTSLATITGSNTGLTILTAIPTVNAITDVVSGLTSNGSMVTSGAIITFALTTSVPLTVSGGTPLLDLSNGTTATYAGINGQGQLTFITTVAPGHDTSDLSVTSLQNNGAVIADAAGVPLATTSLATITGSNTGLSVVPPSQDNVDVFIGSAANYGELTETAIADPLLATGNIGLYGPMGAVFGQTFTNQMAAMAAEWSGTGSGVSELGEGNGLASGSVTLTNTTGKTILIPVGSSFATASGVNFQAVADIHAGNWASNGTANDLGWYTVGAGASVTIPVEATSFGAGGNVAANAVANAAVAGLVVTASTAMSGGQSWTNPAQNNQGGFISTTPTQYTSVYSAQGYDPAETDVNVDGSHSWTAQDLQAWEGYVNNCRSVGILNVAPILSDNDYTADLAQPFATSAWFANERAAALYGGGLAFDTPPGYFFARNWDGYESNIEQQIQWCNQNGLRSSVIISPYALPNEPIVAGQAQGDDNLFLQKTEKFLADLKAAGALPTQIIVENYNAPASANYFDASTADVNSLNTIAQYAAGLTLSPVTASEAGLEEKDTSQATTTLIVTGVQVSQTIEASATGTPFAEAQLFGKQQSEIATVTVTDQGGLLHLASTVSGVTSENDALVYSGTVGQVTTFLQSLRATSAAATSATTDTLSLSIVDPNGATTEASAPVTIAAPTQITAIAATTSTGLQTLAAGATVTFTVDASRPLTVSGGTPLLDLSNGTTATYAGINGQGQLTFITTVAPGHDTSDLSVTSLQNNGAVIADAAGVPLATTSLATITGSNTGLTILTAIPTVNAITDVVSGLTSNGSMVTSGAIITFALTTSVPLTVSGGTPLLDLSNGTTATYAGINGQGQLTFITTVAPGHDTSDLSVTSLQNNGAVIADAAGVPLATTSLATITGSNTGLSVVPPSQDNVDVFIGSAANYGELTETAIADPLLATGNIGLYGRMGAVFGQTFTNQMAAMAAEWSGTGSGVSELGEGNGLASGSVTLTNTTGKTILIPVGSSFATASGVNFQAVADIHAGNWASNGTANDLGWYTVGAGASVTIPVEATSFGAGGNVAANAVANAAVAGLVVTASTAMSGGQSWTNPAQNNQGGFISTTPTQYTSVYSAQGYDPAETDVNVDGSHSWTAQDLQAWEGYVNNCRSVGILNVAPILSDNGYTADLAQPFATSAWFANERAAALYGGGLAFNTPPGYFFARNWDGYESNIEQQIQWCNQNGLRSSVIISPYALPNEPIVAGQAQGDDNLFLQKTEKFLADLKAAGALPTQIIVENYNAPASANYFDASTADVNSLNTIAQYAAGLTLSPVTASEAGLEEKDTSQATTTLIVTGVQVSQTIEASATGTPFAEAQLFGKQQSEIATVTVTDQGGLLHLASTVSGVTSENDALVYSGTVGQVTTFLQSLRATSAAATSATTDTLSLSIVDPNGATTEASAPVTIAAPTQITAIAATTSTGLQTLAAGATVTFTVDASRPLTVSGGTPLLDLSNGTTATYAGINGQGQLTFITTVAPGHDTSDLSVTSLQNNGAVIADAAGVPLATTSLATITGSNTGLTILTAIPTVNAIVAPSSSATTYVTSSAMLTDIVKPQVLLGGTSNVIQSPISTNGSSAQAAQLDLSSLMKSVMASSELMSPTNFGFGLDAVASSSRVASTMSVDENAPTGAPIFLVLSTPETSSYPIPSHS